MSAELKPDAMPGHVVRLVPAILETDTAPSELPVPSRVGRGGRAVLLILVVLLTVASIVGVGILWAVSATANPVIATLMNAVFTIIMLAVVIGAWIGYVATGQAGTIERLVQADWRARLGEVRSIGGVIRQRDVNLEESGGVLSFVITVDGDDGVHRIAKWRRDGDTGPLLQPQVPVVGARVRIWSPPADTAGAPAQHVGIVVDALDPSAPSAPSSSDRHS